MIAAHHRRSRLRNFLSSPTALLLFWTSFVGGVGYAVLALANIYTNQALAAHDAKPWHEEGGLKVAEYDAKVGQLLQNTSALKQGQLDVVSRLDRIDEKLDRVIDRLLQE